MVLFLAIDAARAFPPSEPRPLEEASSYVVPRFEREKERVYKKKKQLVHEKVTHRSQALGRCYAGAEGGNTALPLEQMPHHVARLRPICLGN
jgi:hypothetical protein